MRKTSVDVASLKDIFVVENSQIALIAFIGDFAQFQGL
jgi:hypothetical protein